MKRVSGVERGESGRRKEGVKENGIDERMDWMVEKKGRAGWRV